MFRPRQVSWINGLSQEEWREFIIATAASITDPAIVRLGKGPNTTGEVRCLPSLDEPFDNDRRGVVNCAES